MAAGHIMPCIALMLAQRGQGEQVCGLALLDDLTHRRVRSIDHDRIDRPG